MSFTRLRYAAAVLAMTGGTMTTASALVPTAPPASASGPTVCNVFCDGRNPALAAGDRQAATAVQWSRNIRLHLDDPDDMAWAAIDNGTGGDQTWMERSFDGGRTSSQIALTTIPTGQTQQRSQMFDIDGTPGAGPGSVRACGKAGNRPDVSCTAWTDSVKSVCDVFCDGRDPALAAGDRQAATAVQWSRNIRLHFDDPENLAWAAIDSGSPTDEVWLERSFDGGRTTSSSRLGDATIPTGRTQARGVMFTVDNPLLEQVGAVRACGKAGDRPEISCTPWAHSTAHAANPRAATMTALAQYWNPRTGQWSSDTTTWDWKDANALTALADYATRTGDTRYVYIISGIFDHNIHNDGTTTLVNFTDSYIDDTGWWGLAWLRAYDLTGDTRYLDTAKADADYMASYWDGTCGGGVWWSTARTYKNAIANELYLDLNAALHNHLPGDSVYLGRATAEWNWFSGTGLINSRNLVNDGLTMSTCRNNGQQTWTYNQGVILEGLAQLNRATGNAALLTVGTRIATAATSNLTSGGVLTEPPTGSQSCADDVSSFKGVFMRDLYAFSQDAHSTAYDSFFAAQKASVTANDSDLDSQVGYFWAGPKGVTGYACQQSAQDALNAAS